jgi:hypothetical protein
MPTCLKCDESVRGGVILPFPPIHHKNTTKEYLQNKKQTTPAICSCRRHYCSHHHCWSCRRHVLCQEPPPLPASLLTIPFAGIVTGNCCCHGPCCPHHCPHHNPHFLLAVILCHPLSTPTVVTQVIAHRHCRCSPPPASRMSRQYRWE